MNLFQKLLESTNQDLKKWLNFQDYLGEILDDKFEIKFNSNGMFLFKCDGKILIKNFKFDCINLNTNLDIFDNINDEEIITLIKGKFDISDINVSGGSKFDKDRGIYNVDITFKDVQTCILMFHKYYNTFNTYDNIPSMDSLEALNKSYSFYNLLKNSIIL